MFVTLKQQRKTRREEIIFHRSLGNEQGGGTICINLSSRRMFMLNRDGSVFHRSLTNRASRGNPMYQSDIKKNISAKSQARYRERGKKNKEAKERERKGSYHVPHHVSLVCPPRKEYL